MWRMTIISLSFCTYFLELGGGMSAITLILASLASVPRVVIMWPNNLAEVTLNTHFSRLIFILYWLSLLKTSLNWARTTRWFTFL